MNGDVSLGRWVSLLYRYGQIYLARELAPYDIGRGQFLFLLVLYRQDGMPQDELAHILNIDKGTTARALSKLEQAGYIRREPDTKNLRSNLIHLTDQAKKFKPQLRTILNRWTNTLSAGMTEAEVEQAINLLSRMARNAVEHIRQEKNQPSAIIEAARRSEPDEAAK